MYQLIIWWPDQCRRSFGRKGHLHKLNDQERYYHQLMHTLYYENECLGKITEVKMNIF